MIKNKSMMDLLLAKNKEMLLQAPIIARVMYFHEENQKREKKSQYANYKIMKDCQEKKRKFQVSDKLKNQEITKRLDEERDKKIAVMKDKSEHVQEVIAKFHKLNEEILNDKTQSMNKKISKIQQLAKQDHENSLRSQEWRSRSKCLSNSLESINYYQEKLKKTELMCSKVLKKSIEKQKMAQDRRKDINQNRKIKYLNFIKQLRRIKAVEYLQNKQNQTIQKSARRFQLLEKKNEKYIMKQKQKLDVRMYQEESRAEKFKEKKRKLQIELKQKLMKLDKMVRERSVRVEENKENFNQNLIRNKKEKRIKHENQILQRFDRNYSCFSSRMSQLYNKDREQWCFVTNVEQLKNILIEKNRYENNQNSLNKFKDCNWGIHDC